MHPYIPHLLDDIRAAHRTEQPQGPASVSFLQVLEDIRARYSNPGRTLGYYCGLAAEQFPPPDQLLKKDMTLVCSALRQMLRSWNVTCYLPKGLPPELTYTLLIQVLERRIDPLSTLSVTFSFCSVNGFREGRNAHQAVMQAQENLNAGYEWVAELDLEKFFDKVNHDKLMGHLAKKITEKRTLKLIRSYLTSGIMEGGVTNPRTEGTPQGSPLSPLLSNIVLHELDKELQARGHRFVRYADDCSIYVRSEKSAQRVMETITDYIESKLKLKVNRSKSKVSRPHESTLLGFSFYRHKGSWEIRIAPRSLKRITQKIKEQTQRNNPSSAKEKIKKMEAIIRGWVNYFSIAKATKWMKELDARTRMRLRMGIWKQWKNAKTRMSNLEKLGIKRHEAYKWSYSRKSYCRVAHSQILHVALNNAYFTRLRYIGFADYYYWKTTHQTKLF